MIHIFNSLSESEVVPMFQRNNILMTMVALLSVFSIQALVVSSTAQAVTIDWVTVGNPGNAADTQVMNDLTTGYGSVGTTYRIDKYEVTNAQYTEFLNAVAATGQLDPTALYNTSMGSDVRGGIARAVSGPNYVYTVKADMGNKPVNFVSFYDALRFAN
jgi:formylglycine-generating enzyme required for sulfatase activity